MSKETELPTMQFAEGLSVPEFHDPKRNERIRAAIEQVRNELETDLATLHAPGFAWGLVVDDALVASGAGGVLESGRSTPVTTDSVFRIGSITKALTAAAVLQLHEQAKLQLDTGAAKYWAPLGGVVYPERTARPLSIRDLLVHGSGLPRVGDLKYTDPRDPPIPEDVVAALDGVVLEYSPGTGSGYSNLGFAVLGMIVQQVAGQLYESYVEEHLLNPLGMDDTSFSRTTDTDRLARPHRSVGDGFETVEEWSLGAANAAGGAYSTVPDLAKFLVLQLRAWDLTRPGISPVLSPATVRASHEAHGMGRMVVSYGRQKPTTDEDAQAAELTATVGAPGLGWSVRQNCRFARLVWKNGGTEGHRSLVAFLPRRGVGVIVLTNGSDDRVDELAFQFLERLSDADVIPPRSRALGSSWRKLVQRLLTDVAHMTPADYTQVVSEGFAEAVPLPRLQGIMERIRQSRGACQWAGPIDVPASTRGRAAFRCTHGWLSVWAQLTETNQERIGGLLLNERETDPRNVGNCSVEPATLD